MKYDEAIAYLKVVDAPTLVVLGVIDGRVALSNDVSAPFDGRYPRVKVRLKKGFDPVTASRMMFAEFCKRLG